MSVLDRKLFRGGVANFKHGGDLNIDHETGQNKNATNQLSGIVSGINAFTPTATDIAEQLYPTRNADELRKEASLIFDTDYSQERALLEEQKKEDFASSLISFGARLASGRGKALDIIAGAAAETVPELSQARRGTRAQEAQLVGLEKKSKNQIKQYVLSEQQKNQVARSNVMTTALFSNLSMFQDMNKALFTDKLASGSTFLPGFVIDNRTGKQTKVSILDYKNDLINKTNFYSLKQEYDEPLYVYDKVFKSNRVFTDREQYELLNKEDPKRFDKYRDESSDPYKKVNVNGKVMFKRTSEIDPTKDLPADNLEYLEVIDKQNNGETVFLRKDQEFDTNRFVPKQMNAATVKRTVFAQYTDPISGELVQDVAREMDDTGNILIPLRDKNNEYILNADFTRQYVPLGKVADFSPMTDVDVKAEDIYKPSDKLKIFSHIQGNEISIKNIRKVLVNIIDDKTRVGLVGSVRDVTQKVQGIVTDFIQAQDQTEIVEKTKLSINSAYDYDDPMSKILSLDEDILYPNKSFDPKFAENRVLVNSIAYAVARARKKTGRLNLDDVRNARESLNLGGLNNADTVISGLKTVMQELSDYNISLKMRYKLVGGTYPSDYVGLEEFDVNNLPQPAYNAEGEITELVLPTEDVVDVE